MQLEGEWPTIRERLAERLDDETIDFVIEKVRSMLPRSKHTSNYLWCGGWNAYRDIMRQILDEVPYERQATDRVLQQTDEVLSQAKSPKSGGKSVNRKVRRSVGAVNEDGEGSTWTS